MYQVIFTGARIKSKDGKERRKRLARASVATDNAAEALNTALAVTQKQTKAAQAAVEVITLRRVSVGEQKDIVFNVESSK